MLVNRATNSPPKQNVDQHWPNVGPLKNAYRDLSPTPRDLSSENMDRPTKEKVLLAFDFDHTLIEENSDYYVRRLAPSGAIPQEILELHSDHGWTKCMAETFKFLHKNDITPQQILDCMAEIPLTHGMNTLLENISKDKVEVIIISDANSVFIEHILQSQEKSELIDTVFTNPAFFDETGLLQLEGYHVQDHCQLSTKNLCKGQILEDYIADQSKNGISYTLIGYIGDGFNDFCPGLRLSERDLFFPRKDFSLVRHIDRMEKEKGLKVRAETCIWSSGEEILEKLKEKVPDAVKSL